MSKVFFDIGISLDGFMAGDNRGPQNPIGDDGPLIHEWMYDQKVFTEMHGESTGKEGADNDLIKSTLSRTGAYIMGKRMFEEGEKNWPEDLYKAPVYVLTHEKREPWRQKGTTVFYFVNESVEKVLANAKENAKGKDVRLEGGGELIQQFLNAGLVDEFIIHVAPLSLGNGIRLLDNLDKDRVKVKLIEVIDSKKVTHIRYRLIK